MSENRVAIQCFTFLLALAACCVSISVDAASWCATYRNGGSNCGFYSQEQCLAATSGAGGSCGPNFSESGVEKPAARKERKAKAKPMPKRNEKERVAPVERPAPPPVAAQPVPTLRPANNFQTARALILSGKYEAGIAAMKSLGYDDHPDVASTIGFASSKLGRLDEARVWYDKALAADPNHLGTWSYSGALYVAQGDIAKARGDLEHIKSICGGPACREYQELESLIAAKNR